MRVLAIFGAAVFVGSVGSVPAAAQDSATAVELTDQGFVHCSHPDARRKTCRSIDTFERIREGVYNSTSVMAVGGGVTLEIYTPAWLVDGAYCGTIREQDVYAGIFRVNGREVPAQAATAATEQVLKQLRPLIDQEYCVRYDRAGADFIGKVTFNGEYRPEFDDPIKMIRPSDGYRVAR